MEYLKIVIDWVKANKKKTVIGLVVVLIVLNLLGVIGGECGEAACDTATISHLCSGVCTHGLGS
jgi:hypothetical protein